jgi:hypothetical protein
MAGVIASGSATRLNGPKEECVRRNIDQEAFVDSSVGHNENACILETTDREQSASRFLHAPLSSYLAFRNSSRSTGASCCLTNSVRKKTTADGNVRSKHDRNREDDSGLTSRNNNSPTLLPFPSPPRPQTLQNQYPSQTRPKNNQIPLSRRHVARRLTPPRTYIQRPQPMTARISNRIGIQHPCRQSWDENSQQRGECLRGVLRCE